MSMVDRLHCVFNIPRGCLAICLGMHLVIARRTLTNYDSVSMPDSGSIPMPHSQSFMMMQGTSGSC